MQYSTQYSFVTKIWYSVFNTAIQTCIQYSEGIQFTKNFKYSVFTVFGIHVIIGQPGREPDFGAFSYIYNIYCRL